MLSRRSTLFGLLAAPAVIRLPKLLMPLSPQVLEVPRLVVNYDIISPTPFTTMVDITEEMVRLWRNSNAFIEALNNEWDTSGAKIGSQLRIRLPNHKEKNYG